MIALIPTLVAAVLALQPTPPAIPPLPEGRYALVGARIFTAEDATPEIANGVLLVQGGKIVGGGAAHARRQAPARH